MSKKLIAFMNAYSQGKSGSDICFIEVAKRMPQYDKLVVTSLLGKELCERGGLKAEYLVTTKEYEFRNIGFTYFRRIIKALLFKLRGDVIYATSDFLPDVLPSFLGKLVNKDSKWVQKIYHLIPKGRPISYYAQKLSFILIKWLADLVFVDNSFLKRDLEKLGFNRNNIVVNPLGIDTESIRIILPAETNYDGVFLGRLKPSKGIFDLISIWRLVCKERPSTRLAIIGYADRNIQAVMKEKIKELGMERNIDLLGYLESQGIGILKAGKIFIFPSYEEGFGIAIAEAMACGLPVVAYDLPVYKENFTKGIIKIPLGEIEGFSNAVIELLENREKYLLLKEEALKLSKRFSWDVTAEAELEYIEKI